MKLRMCRCFMCRTCRRHRANQRIINECKKAGRRTVRQALRRGQYDLLPLVIFIPYTG